jgi:hypothetical protein
LRAPAEISRELAVSVQLHRTGLPGVQSDDRLLGELGSAAGERERREALIGAVDADDDATRVGTDGSSHDDHRARGMPSEMLAHGAEEALSDPPQPSAADDQHLCVGGLLKEHGDRVALS